MEIGQETTGGLSGAWMTVLALLLLAAAAYAHLQIPRYTAGTARIGHAVLIVVGLGLGAVSAAIYAEADDPFAFLAFVIGFGIVHVPTALILWLKRVRGAGKS
jgi:hypothetical protein